MIPTVKGISSIHFWEVRPGHVIGTVKVLSSSERILEVQQLITKITHDHIDVFDLVVQVDYNKL
jgi:hypothetical protein